MYYIYGISGPSLLIESTDSMIIGKDHFTETTFMECLTNCTDGYGMAQNFMEKNIHGHSQTTE